MKKIMALAALVCFLFTGALSVFQVKTLAAESAKQEAAIIEDAPAVTGTDYEALYRSHPAEEVVATVNGEPVLWDEYFYFYCGYVAEVESIMDYYGQQGVPLSWEGEYKDGMTWADVPAESAEQSILEYRGIHLFAEENGIALPADAEEQIDTQAQFQQSQHHCQDNRKEGVGTGGEPQCGEIVFNLVLGARGVNQLDHS